MESQTTAEDDLEEVLKTGDYKFFIEVLVDGFGESLKRRIKFHSSGFLTIDERRDVFQKALIQIYKKIQEPTFDPIRPMAFVNRVVRFRTLDARRTKRRQKAKTNTDELLSAMATSSGMDGFVAVWRNMSPENQEAFMSEVRRAIADKLPEGQRVVAQVYFDNPECSWAELIVPIAAVTGKRSNASTIRSQWRHARQTIAEHLSRKFDFVRGTQKDA